MSGESKIVNLRGDPLPEPGQPVESMVAALEAALERARQGETVGLALVEIDHAYRAFWSVRGWPKSFAFLGALASCHADLAAEINLIQDP